MALMSYETKEVVKTFYSKENVKKERKRKLILMDFFRIKMIFSFVSPHTVLELELY